MSIAAWKEIMRKHKTAAVTGAALLTILIAISAFGRDHNALNGTWTLVPAKSDFAGQPVVQTGTVTIAARDGIIIVSRRFAYKGSTETFFYNDVTDAENNATIRSGKDIKSKTRWDHDILKVTTTDSGATTLESYALAEDGRMTVHVEKSGREPFTGNGGFPSLSARKGVSYAGRCGASRSARRPSLRRSNPLWRG